VTAWRRRRGVIALAVAVLLCGCGRDGIGQRDTAAVAAGAGFRERDLCDLKRTGALSDRALAEASGLTPSSRVPGVLWSHNDSGNDPVLFALDATGARLGRVVVRGAKNRDWEAIATGPCPDGSCLYIGDVGDNSARRDSVAIWRVREPLPADSMSARVELLSLRFPQGPRDVEAMWVGPDTTVWLVTKRPIRDAAGRFRPALVYRLRAAAWQPGGRRVAAPAELVDSLPWVPTRAGVRDWITDAALSPPQPDGTRRLALRTYQHVLVFEADPLTGAPGRLLARCSLRMLRERQGEAVAWMDDGRLLFLGEGRGVPVHVGRCP
jgi:hypothetical protein